MKYLFVFNVGWCEFGFYEYKSLIY